MQDIKRLENRIVELEQENKNLHETIAYLTKKYMEEVQRHQTPDE